VPTHRAGRLGQPANDLARHGPSSLDELAADRFVSLRRQRIRIGTMDLKIAAIALVNDALLVSANVRDYSAVPDLRCDNWLRP
jgi:tRNA(fMet)-specific endonuclease VapC